MASQVCTFSETPAFITNNLLEVVKKIRHLCLNMINH